MVEDGGSPDSGGRPDPTKVTTAAEFVDAMRRLKLWTGWGYRRLEKNAAAAGQALPRSTLTVALARTTLPREELVTALARACGCDDDQTGQWVAARRRIVAAPAPLAEARSRPRVWPVRVAVIVLVLAMAATIAGILLRNGNPVTPDQAQAVPAQPDGGGSEPDPPTGTTATTTSTTPTDPGLPAVPTTSTTTGPVPRTTPPASSRSEPEVPPRPITTAPRPSTPTMPSPPTRESFQLSDGRTAHCPLPYRMTGYGPLTQCTLLSGSKATIVYHSPFATGIVTLAENLPLIDPTWYDAPTMATDGVRAQTRGFATVESPAGPAVWATQYEAGYARIGTVNLSTGRFVPDPSGAWLPVVNT